MELEPIWYLSKFITTLKDFFTSQIFWLGYFQTHRGNKWTSIAIKRTHTALYDLVGGIRQAKLESCRAMSMVEKWSLHTHLLIAVLNKTKSWFIPKPNVEKLNVKCNSHVQRHLFHILSFSQKTLTSNTFNFLCNAIPYT